MSDNESEGGIVGLIKVGIFIVVLIVSAPFLAIGHYKNGQIKSLIEGSLDKMKKYDFVESQKKMEEATDHFGILYDCYVMVLPVVGGTYYDKKSFYGLRGVVRTGGLAQRMANYDLDVDSLIEEIELDLDRRGTFTKDLKSLQTMAQDQMKALKKLLPIMRDCKNQNYDKAVASLRIFIDNDKNLQYEIVVMPTITVLYELGVNTRDKASIQLATVFSAEMGKKSKNPFFPKMRMKLESITFQSDYAASSSSAPAKPSQPKKLTLKQKFDSGVGLMKKKQFQKAVTMLKECYNEKPENDKICYALALAHKNVGQNQEAKKICDEILLRNPESAKVKKLLASLK